MKTWWRACLWLAAGLIGLAGQAQAHLMVAQKGTVNFKGDSAFLMVSLPVSAFRGFDDDGDRQLSMQELQRHAPLLQQQFVAAAQLRVDGQTAPFETLVLNLSAPDDKPAGPATQLLVMGRYVLPGDPAQTATSQLRFGLGLFGLAPDERHIELSFTREGRTQVHAFSPDGPERVLFQSGLSLLKQQVASGAGHVLGGADHLLFLLVVMAEALAARRGWRHGLALITAFTLGHGLTLAGTVLGWFQFSPAWVEPSIAATIVLMALFTLIQLRKPLAMPAGWQLALVSGCALVHGLGLGDALRSQGWSREDLPWALAGFNVGVELAQLAVAAGGVLLLLLSQRVAGAVARPVLAHAASIGGAVMGVWWLLERMAVLS